MRLACPNCDARYEVPDDAIPLEGRDVQCSNCGTAWFEAGSAPAPLSVAAEVPFPEQHRFQESFDDIPAPPPPATPEATSGVAAEDTSVEDALDALLAQEDATAADLAPVAPPAGSDDDPADATEPATKPSPVEERPKRELEESVRSILREEAERETEARRLEAQRSSNRRAEAESEMQTQADLGMDTQAPTTLTPAQKRLAMLRGEDLEPAVADQAKLPARRDLLPDVEAINSTLQPNDLSDHGDLVEAGHPQRRSGFRSGFLLAVLILAGAAGLYVGADRIAVLSPETKPYLESYVVSVDGLRLWLTGSMERVTTALRDL